MILLPAIDLRGGRCVRLVQGDPARQTVFSDDPAAMAAHWADEGARWLHLVNLDGALGEGEASRNAAEAVVRVLRDRSIPVEYGGGLRTLDQIRRVMDWGIQRVILGTAALQDPDLVVSVIEAFGADAVVVALDARDGRVAVRGWAEQSAVTALDLAARMADRGVRRVMYTDIGRDGTHEGPNVTRTGELAEKSGLRVIASGGVGTLDHLRQLRWIESYGVEGVIVGRALYDGHFTIAEAQALLDAAPPDRLGR